MGLKQFHDALDSLKGYSGMVGMMGGEPTIHPHFPELALCMATRRPDPLPDHKQYLPAAASEWEKVHSDVVGWRPWQKGLWTSLGPGYKRHYELIQDVFRYQCINDHRGGCKHRALLVSRVDLGIPNDEWIKYRNSCWLQRMWSASITPRGAYFCEVAAALADLFDGPDGLPLDGDWWKRKPEDFGDQLSMCEFCSACLPVPDKVDACETDLVSQSMFDHLRMIGSTKAMIVVHETWAELKAKYRAITDTEPYMDDSDGRRIHTPCGLEVGELHCVVVSRGYDDYLALTLPRTVEEVKNVYVVTSASDTATQELATRCGATLVIDHVLDDELTFEKGTAIAHVLAKLPENAWVLQLDADIILRKGFGNRVRSQVLNPGALYFTERVGPPLTQWREAAVAAKMALENTDWGILRENYGDVLFRQKAPWGFFQLYNLGANCLARKPTRYPSGHKSAEHDDRVIAYDWFGKERCMELASVPLAMHLPHCPSRTNWHGRSSPRLDDDHWWCEDSRLLWRINYRSGNMFTGLWQLMHEIRLPEGVIVEIGTMLGDSAIIMSASLPGAKIITVDPGPNEIVQANAAARTAPWPNITRWKMFSADAARAVKAAGIKVAMVYIDGDHSEAGVTADIKSWEPLVVPGGYICGHDYGDPNWSGVQRAVDKAFGKPHKTYMDASWLVRKGK